MRALPALNSASPSWKLPLSIQGTLNEGRPRFVIQAALQDGWVGAKSVEMRQWWSWSSKALSR